MPKSLHVLVTGSAGRIGRAVVRELKTRAVSSSASTSSSHPTPMNPSRAIWPMQRPSTGPRQITCRLS
jgi:uncharacterized protein YbjT (DUF2867 family)